MGERFGEAGRRIHLQQEIGDARGRDLLVRSSTRSSAPVGAAASSFSICRTPFSIDPPGSCLRERHGQLAQPHVEASLPVCQPFLRPQWHSETTAFRDGLCRNECVFQIAIAPGPSKPDISGAERIAQMEQHRDLPWRASPALWARRWRCHFELGRRSWSSRHRSNRYEGRHRFQKRQCNGRSSQIEQAQHAWSVSAEAVITVEHMIERIVGHGGGQPGCHCNKGFKPSHPDPLAMTSPSGWPSSCASTGRPRSGEGFQGVTHHPASSATFAWQIRSEAR